MNVERDNMTEMKKEISPPKESEFILMGRIVISGHPGTGKSAVIEGLARRYGLPSNRKIKIGDLVRQRALETTGKELGGFYQRPVEDDRMVDEMQIGLMANADPNYTFILESKLGGFFAREIKKRRRKLQKATPQIISILLTCDDDIRYKRVYQRDKKRRPNLTPSQSRKETEEREFQDLKQWRKAHPSLEGIDPLSPSSRSMYDINIDTSHLSTKEVEENIHISLLRRSAVVRN